MDKHKIVLRASIILGMGLVMFVLLLLTSNKIHVLGQMVPFEIVYAGVILGIIGVPLYAINKTPFKYVIFSPAVLLLFLFLLRGDAHA